MFHPARCDGGFARRLETAPPTRREAPRFPLAEVPRARAEQVLARVRACVAGDVLDEVRVEAADSHRALRVAHLAEDEAVRAGEALNRERRAVGVVRLAGGGAAVLVAVLAVDLPVLEQRLRQRLRDEDFALAVADGNVMRPRVEHA